MTRETVSDIELRDSVRLYNAGFRISPGQVEVRGRVVEITFHIQVSGSHEGQRGNANTPCRACVGVLKTLFDIADLLLPFEREALKRIGKHERYMHYSRESNGQCGISLAIAVKARRPFERADDGWAMEFWREVARLLRSYGCRELPAAETAAEAVPIHQASRRFGLGRPDDIDSFLAPVA